MRRSNIVNKKITIKESGIHGLGLFAAELIKKDEQIGEIAAVPSKQDGPHILWVDGIKGYKVSGPLKYINHCSNPNACYFDDLTVAAIRDIAAGEEITHDYGEDW